MDSQVSFTRIMRHADCVQNSSNAVAFMRQEWHLDSLWLLSPVSSPPPPPCRYSRDHVNSLQTLLLDCSPGRKWILKKREGRSQVPYIFIITYKQRVLEKSCQLRVVKREWPTLGPKSWQQRPRHQCCTFRFTAQGHWCWECSGNLAATCQSPSCPWASMSSFCPCPEKQHFLNNNDDGMVIWTNAVNSWSESLWSNHLGMKWQSFGFSSFQETLLLIITQKWSVKLGIFCLLRMSHSHWI